MWTLSIMVFGGYNTVAISEIGGIGTEATCLRVEREYHDAYDKPGMTIKTKCIYTGWKDGDK